MAWKNLEEDVSKMPPIYDWFQVENRWVSQWNGILDPAGDMSILKAPHIDEMLRRCNLDEWPPKVCIPDLPASLPNFRELDANSGKVIWPFMWPSKPTSRLG